ncbi:MAG: UvrD-helicase domain-containing protein [Clostridia bacterium]|nr:UvrD-helicase domain-containing protein [Clostridia bacterium]
MGEVKWTKAQELAIGHNGSDLIISAAAGSGKSATLTERIIRKIKGGSDISRMLIVTFTKAATGELKNKISTALGKALNENPNNAHIQEQIIRVGSSDICTIDSFCMRLVRPNFDKLQLDADFRIGDSYEIDILERETMAEIIDELYESENKDKDFLLVADCYSNIWNEEELGKSLLKLRGKLLSTSDGLEMLLKNESYTGDFFSSSYGLVLKRYIFEALDYLLPIYNDAIKDFKSDPKGSAYLDLFSRELDYLNRLKRAFDSGKGYDEIKEIVNDIDFPRMSATKLSDSLIPLAFYKYARNTLKEFAMKLQEEFFQSSEAGIKSSLKQNFVICKAIYNILKKFEVALLKKKRQFSVYSFNDISNFALSLLYDENDNITSLAKDIASKYDEIYIDEYQDTNSVQDKLFRAISKNNRFMVGDIKQSIYRFRSAEPEIFSYYRTHFDKIDSFNKNSLGLSIFMSNNFRCDKKVIDFSNLVSNYMFLNSLGVPYESSDELIYSKDLPDIYEHASSEACLINTTGLGRGNGPKYEAEYVAKRIKHMIDCEYLPNGEKIRPSHIAILLRNYKSNHKLYTEALEKYGISSRYEVAEGFFEKPHIMLFNCILNAIDNPSRDIYLAGAMRSQIFDFSLDELVKIRKYAEKSASLYSSLISYNKDKALREKLDKFLQKLQEIKLATRKMTSYEAISYVMGRCGFISMCNSEEKNDLIRLYNIAREYEGSSFKGLYSFLKHIEKLIDSKGDKSFRGDTAKENVKIMTIHSSKGLEFEVCFVCNLEDAFNHSDTGEPILFQRQLGIAGYVGKEDGLAKFKTMARKCIALQISRDMREEEMRILYVAMTRARSRLILTCATGEPKKNLDIFRDGKKYIKPYLLYNASSLYSFTMGGICEPHASFDTYYVDASELSLDGEATENDTGYSRENVDRYKDIIDKRISFKYKYDYLKKLPSKMSISKLYPEILDGNENDDIDIQPLKDKPRFLDSNNEEVLASERGTATHVFMQFCDFKNLVNNGVQAELERLVDGAFISKRDSEIVNIEHLEAFIKSDLLANILTAKKVIREFRFNVMLDASEFSNNEALKNEKVLVQGVTDCIYENELGELILVDYKTDYVTLDNYESVLRKRHTTQLTYYKKACELMFEKPVAKVLIYSVPLAKTVEI